MQAIFECKGVHPAYRKRRKRHHCAYHYNGRMVISSLVDDAKYPSELLTDLWDAECTSPMRRRIKGHEHDLKMELNRYILANANPSGDSAHDVYRCAHTELSRFVAGGIPRVYAWCTIFKMLQCYFSIQGKGKLRVLQSCVEYIPRIGQLYSYAWTICKYEVMATFTPHEAWSNFVSAMGMMDLGEVERTQEKKKRKIIFKYTF